MNDYGEGIKEIPQQKGQLKTFFIKNRSNVSMEARGIVCPVLEASFWFKELHSLSCAQLTYL